MEAVLVLRSKVLILVADDVQRGHIQPQSGDWNQFKGIGFSLEPLFLLTLSIPHGRTSGNTFVLRKDATWAPVQNSPQVFPTKGNMDTISTYAYL